MNEEFVCVERSPGRVPEGTSGTLLPVPVLSSSAFHTFDFETFVLEAAEVLVGAGLVGASLGDGESESNRTEPS